MAINLKKGQGINLSKSEYDLSNVTIGLGWDIAKPGLLGGLLGRQKEYDLDAIAFLCHADGKVHNLGNKLVDSDVVFYNNMSHSSGCVVLTGDNRTGAGDGDDEQIIARLDALPAQFEKVVFVVSIYQGTANKQHFGKVDNAFIRAVDARGKEMVRVDLSASAETNEMCSTIFAELNRNRQGWEFKALLQPQKTDAFVQVLRDHYLP